MRVKISEIKVRKRIRKENGNIEMLMDSLRLHGLMNPIVISEKYELIAGFRRLTAAKALGWETIPVTIVDAKAKVTRLELELEENIQRLDFTEDEIFEGIAALERYKNPNYLQKIWQRIIDFFAWFFDKNEAKNIKKRRRNAALSVLAIIGILAIIFTGILFKNGYISAILVSLLNVLSFCIFIVGIFYFIRFCRGIEKK